MYHPRACTGNSGDRLLDRPTFRPRHHGCLATNSLISIAYNSTKLSAIQFLPFLITFKLANKAIYRVGFAERPYGVC